MKILVTGENGQLGSEVKKISTDFSDLNFVFTGRQKMDLQSDEQIRNVMHDEQPDVVLNCAAYTAVDKAEEEKDKAFRVNGDAVKTIAEVCSQIDALLIQASTDFVFDGKKTTPYKEVDQVNPLNVYGASKLKGEQEALSNHEKTVIVRTSWVYSSFGSNFVKTMVRLGQSRDNLSVVSDQKGTPTYAKDLAGALIQLLIKIKGGKGQKERVWDQMQPLSHNIYHYTNDGETTWCDFAKEIMKIARLNCRVEPISSEDYGVKTPRPSYSVLDNSKIKEQLGIGNRNWRSALKECISLLEKDSKA